MENPNSDLTLCLPGEAILRQPCLQPFLAQLKSLISAPADIYHELYGVTLLRFAELCQAMPFDPQNTQPYGLMQRQLELALTALKLRRGKLLPQHSDSESIAEQEPLWTYAVFSTCLLIGLHRLQTDRTVELYRNAQEKIGLWSVLTGNLFEPKTYYQICAASPELIPVDPACCQALLVGKIIPCHALRWLTAHPAVFTSWWQAILAADDSGNQDGFMFLIRQAAEKITHPIAILIRKDNDESKTAS